jgi:hypothetical protein
MATTSISKSALLSGAAKDDAVGVNGDFTFTIQDLLANDPGGAAKVSVDSQFFFGTTAADQANQAAYLDAHGITNNGDGTYSIQSDALDFDYFVQIGNKGTWSTAHVDVVDTPDPPPVPHAGDLLFAENFDYSGIVPINDPATGNAVAGVIDLNALNGWTGAAHTELGMDGYGGISSTSGNAWLDTQNSPGGIDISHTFVDPTGDKALLSFDIAFEDLTFNGQNYATDLAGNLQFKIDGQVVSMVAENYLNGADWGPAQADQPHAMEHFDFVIDTGAPGSTHTLEIVDISASGYAGFAVDSIAIHDWII